MLPVAMAAMRSIKSTPDLGFGFHAPQQAHQTETVVPLDGGKGQVSVVQQALHGTMMEHVPLFGMVKDDHHRTRAIVNAQGQEIAIQMNRGTFTFVTSIQDEVHRYANEYRKQQYNKKSYASTLTEVPGVGPATAKMILKKMGSVAAVRAAAREELEALPGIGPVTAAAIWDHFHTNSP